MTVSVNPTLSNYLLLAKKWNLNKRHFLQSFFSAAAYQECLEHSPPLLLIKTCFANKDQRCQLPAGQTADNIQRIIQSNRRCSWVDSVAVKKGSGQYRNMSYYNLMDESMMRIPSIPNLNATMLFIETHPCLPPISAVSIGRHCTEMLKNLDNYEEENSLGLELDKKTKPQLSMASTSSIKKKKTGCTCKKTKCLKMYCECFSSGKMCTPECSCYGCVNDHDHLTEIQNAKTHLQQKHSSASKQAHKGCNCKKSMCQKKYCECFNAGMACGQSCKCEECANGEDAQHNHHHGHPSKEGLPSTEINVFNSLRGSICSQPMLSGTFE